MTRQRLIILYDGTWNDPQDRTNVYRLARDLHDYDGEVRQRFFYDPGVGTGTFDRIRGGAFGWGLSANLRQGYDWLARRYREGDEIWVFGFSRGAYTARSLVGMLRKCGLLRITTPSLIEAAEELYRDKYAPPDSGQCVRFRQRYSREVRVHFIGVWDTVGALGVPGTLLSERGLFSWFDTQLSKIVDHAYHAVALDEHRAAYDVALWTSESGQPKPDQREVEQRWFAGAHANVGGGYGDDPLAELPLAWIEEKAVAAGLKLDPSTPPADAWQAPARDSFKEFLGGAYGFFQGLFGEGDGRHQRRFDRGHLGLPAINVTVDPSVWARWRQDPGYRPPTLTRAGLTPPPVSAAG